jgi:UDP-glucose 4-epimerase|tara:strand:+ start:3915 stop:4808 length:894 start_codon:yes stop_codon:yes gene_type:complete
MSKKVIVTGGAGFVGTNLIKALNKKGYKCISLDNYSTGSKKNHIEGNLYINTDISKEYDQYLHGSQNEILKDNKVYDDVIAIFHLAAYARIQPSFKRTGEYFNNNIGGMVKILEVAKEKNIPVIYSGSSSHHSGKYKNPYTFSKEVGEELIKLYQDLYDIKASVARFYNVYGPYQLEDGPYCTVIGKWLRQKRNKEKITIYGDGSKRRDFTHVGDIVDGLIKILEYNIWGKTFEFGTGINYSLNELAALIDNKVGVKYEDDKPGEAQSTKCDYFLATDLLNWKPKIKLESWIKEEKS